MIVAVDHNLDPLDGTLQDLFLPFFDSIEQPDFEILFRLHY
jgi:hypothetical protein